MRSDRRKWSVESDTCCQGTLQNCEMINCFQATTVETFAVSPKHKCQIWRQIWSCTACLRLAPSNIATPKVHWRNYVENSYVHRQNQMHKINTRNFFFIVVVVLSVVGKLRRYRIVCGLLSLFSGTISRILTVTLCKL